MLIVAVVYIPVVHTFIYLYRVCIYCGYALALAYQSLQLNLHETDLLFRYLSHHLTLHRRVPVFLKIYTDLQDLGV